MGIIDDLNEQSHIAFISSWAEFRKYLDGTYASLSFDFESNASQYIIYTSDAGGDIRNTIVNKDGGSDQLDFENSFLVLPNRIAGLATSQTNSFTPDPRNDEVSVSNLKIDSEKNLAVRGSVLTDEGSFADNFTGGSLDQVLSGMATFTNGSDIVSGSATLFTQEIGIQQYIKPASLDRSNYIRVIEVLSDSVARIATAFPGSTTTDNITATAWLSETALPDGYVEVVGQQVILSAGGTDGYASEFFHEGDYPPYRLIFTASVTGMVANERMLFGFADNPDAPQTKVCVVFDSTDLTTLKFVTAGQGSPDSTTVIYLDHGNQIVDLLAYELSVYSDVCSLFINGVPVASHRLNLPGPYEVLDIFARVENTGTVAFPQNLIINSVLWVNFDRLDCVTNQGEPAVNDKAWPVKLVSSNSGTDLEFGEDGRIRTSQDSLAFFDNFSSSSLNVIKWNSSNTGMSIAQSFGIVTLNSNNDLTNGDYALLTTAKNFNIFSEYPLIVVARAQINHGSNSVCEFGLGTPTGNAALAQGAFFRVNAANSITLVIGSPQYLISDAVGLNIDPSVFYSFYVTLYKDRCRFRILSSDGAVDFDRTLNLPAGVGSTTGQDHIPFFARTYNTGAASSAASIKISSITVQRLDLIQNKTWSEQMVGLSRSCYINPVDQTQTAQYSNSANPSSASLSNTTPSYTTLGGLFNIPAPLGAVTDYALFAYQVPAGFQLVINSVFITSMNSGASISMITPTVLLWGLGVNSTSASLAATGAGASRRIPLGYQTIAIGAAIGSLYSENINYDPKVPVVIDSGKYFHIIVRIPTGIATLNQTILGTVTVEGYFD